MRSLGLDPGKMERRGIDLREKLFREHPDWTWRQRQEMVETMWAGSLSPSTTRVGKHGPRGERRVSLKG